MIWKPLEKRNRKDGERSFFKIFRREAECDGGGRDMMNEGKGRIRGGEMFAITVEGGPRN